MSRSTADDTDEAEIKQAMKELANSDRATAPVYRELFRREYGEEP